MPMDNRLLRPRGSQAAPTPPPPATNNLIRTISNDPITTASGDRLRTIQNA
jgi:hypothetical protein